MQKIGNEEVKVLNPSSAEGDSSSDKQVKLMIDQAKSIVDVIYAYANFQFNKLFYLGNNRRKDTQCSSLSARSSRWN